MFSTYDVFVLTESLSDISQDTSYCFSLFRIFPSSMGPKKKEDKGALVKAGSSSVGASPRLSVASQDSVCEPLIPSAMCDIPTMIGQITASFTQALNSCVDRIIDALDKKLTCQIEAQASEVFDLSKRIDHLEKNNKDLVAENANLKDTIKNLSSKVESLSQSVDDLDQYSRNSNLLIHGLSQDTAVEPDLSTRVLDYLNANLGTTLHERDINVIHRLPKLTTGTTKSTSAPKHPVLLQPKSSELGSFQAKESEGQVCVADRAAHRQTFSTPEESERLRHLR